MRLAAVFIFDALFIIRWVKFAFCIRAKFLDGSVGKKTEAN